VKPISLPGAPSKANSRPQRSQRRPLVIATCSSAMRPAFGQSVAVSEPDSNAKHRLPHTCGYWVSLKSRRVRAAFCKPYTGPSLNVQARPEAQTTTLRLSLDGSLSKPLVKSSMVPRLIILMPARSRDRGSHLEHRRNRRVDRDEVGHIEWLLHFVAIRRSADGGGSRRRKWACMTPSWKRQIQGSLQPRSG